MVTMDAATADDANDAASDIDADDAAADTDTEEDADAEADLIRRLGWAKVAVLCAAVAFLGFAVGLVVSRDRTPGAGSVDVGFYQDMITHHEQALGVASLVIANGEDPTVRSYAQEVLTFQGFELGVMTQTLADWGFTPADRSDEAMGWMGMPLPVEQMPGLLTDDQLDDLQNAEGAELDALFLEYMAEHHRGGLHMATYAAENADDQGVRDLAARIARNQATEINEYRALAERNGYDITIEPASVPASVAGGSDGAD
jgi:uncharacterized protein (DUF305 family)